MANLVTTTQLAEILGVSRVTLANAVKAGRLTPTRRDSHNRPLFDSAKAVKEWAKWADRSSYQSHHAEDKKRGGRPVKGADSVEPPPASAANEIPSLDGIAPGKMLGNLSGLSEGQKATRMDILKKMCEVKEKQLRIQEKEGRLIAVEKVKDQGIELGTKLMGAIAALPARLSPQLATMNDEHEINELLITETNVMIANIRKDCGIVEADVQSAEGDA